MEIEDGGVTVHDLSCGSCARAITNAVRNVDESAKVEVDHATKRVKVDSSADATRIERTIVGAGYEVEPQQA